MPHCDNHAFAKTNVVLSVAHLVPTAHATDPSTLKMEGPRMAGSTSRIAHKGVCAVHSALRRIPLLAFVLIPGATPRTLFGIAADRAVRAGPISLGVAGCDLWVGQHVSVSRRDRGPFPNHMMPTAWGVAGKAKGRWGVVFWLLWC